MQLDVVEQQISSQNYSNSLKTSASNSDANTPNKTFYSSWINLQAWTWDRRGRMMLG